jgi:hypothetical protein
MQVKSECKQVISSKICPTVIAIKLLSIFTFIFHRNKACKTAYEKYQNNNYVGSQMEITSSKFMEAW